MIPGSVVSWVASQIESLIVRYSLSLGGVGLMQMGMKFPSLIGLLVAEPFARSWNTKQFELAEVDPESAKVISGRMFTTFVFMLLFSGLVIAGCMDSVLRLFTPSDFWGAARIGRIQVVTVILGACYVYLNFGLLFAKATRIHALQQGVFACVKTVLSLLFVGAWGMDGVALSGCLSTSLLLVAGTRRAQGFFRQKIEYRRITALVLVAFTMYLLIAYGPIASLPGFAILQHFISVQIVAFLKSTPLAQWNAGQVLQMMETQSKEAALLLVRLTLCSVFAVTFPLAHPESLRALRRRLTRKLQGA
jgi:O-antigen/teichoic acid export membrane protein